MKASPADGPWQCPACGGLGAHTVREGDHPGIPAHSFHPPDGPGYDSGVMSSITMRGKPEPATPRLDVDLAAMRNVEEMLGTYLSAEEAARASNDVIAKLRLSGFVISRSAESVWDPAFVGRVIDEHYRARLAADPKGPRVHECGSYCGADIAEKLRQ